MTTEVIDISLPLHAGLPVWPDSPGFRFSRSKSIEAGDPVNNGRVDMDVHVGTHIDAPAHFLPDGATVDRLDLDPFLGPAHVAAFPEATAIGRPELDHAGIPPGTERLLLKTDNSDRWAAGTEQTFTPDYVALTLDGAQWLVEHGVRLVGIDYLSVQRYGDPSTTHEVLLDAGIVIVEGLDLSQPDPGPYELLCLPLRLVGGDGAPARAVLRRTP